MVDIGGEVVVKGNNPRNSIWRIGINKPVDDSLAKDNTLQTILHIQDVGLATSGNYRNFYYRNGKKYAHTIDPRTGYPVAHSLLSATILAPDATLADAYATYCMVLGLEESQDFILSQPEVEGCLIYDNSGNFQIWTSPGFQLSE
jgi:thiamine biosynthesis lipoprotein